MAAHMNKRLYLASSSPRRKELLDQIGLAFEIVIPEIDESLGADESASAYVVRMAKEKAAVGAGMTENSDNALFLGSDTVVVCDENVLGKPTDASQAESMLRMLAGKTHRVMTAVAVDGAQKAVGIAETFVTFRALTHIEIQAYCHSKEPFGKAGGYAIQGRAAAFIERIEGSYSCVMGLPLYETAAMLVEAGYKIRESWGGDEPGNTD